MQVKVFEAETMAAALKKVKETFGPDALILSTRTIRTGPLGLLQRPRIEITAAIEEDTAEAAQLYNRSAGLQAAKSEPTHDKDQKIDYRQLWRQRKVIDPVENELRSMSSKQRDDELAGLRAELQELKAAIRELNRPVPQPVQQPAFVQQAVPSRTGMSADLDDPVERLIVDLKARDLDENTAETLARYAGERLNRQQLGDPGYLNRFFLDTIADLIRFVSPLSPGEGQKRLALVGPTGVGKTTTIAKLAAQYLQQQAGKIALFTIDTYRIAAPEQLRIYGDIMNLPVEVIYSPEQLHTAFAAHSDKDLILIDTSGRSHHDQIGMKELESFLGPDARTENHLVLATGTRGQDLTDIIASFRRIPLSSLIFSKIDETRQRGALLDIPLRQNLPISYLTNGQRVPEDILTARPQLVAQCILGQQ